MSATEEKRGNHSRRGPDGGGGVGLGGGQGHFQVHTVAKKPQKPWE